MTSVRKYFFYTSNREMNLEEMGAGLSLPGNGRRDVYSVDAVALE